MINLIQGDCLEKMQDIESGSIDLILTDPPYGSTKCKWDSIIPLAPMWEQLKRIIKKNGAIVLFGNEPFSSTLRVSNINQFKYDWVWDKITARGHLVAKKRPLQQTETISVFCAGVINYQPIMIDRPKNKYKTSKEFKRTTIMNGETNSSSYKVYKTWYPKNIISISNANATNDKNKHPTQKPVVLMEYLIKTYTNEGEIVLDFTMGSGSTGVAAKNLNRKFIGIEKDPCYFKIAKNRIENHTVQLMFQ